PFPPASLLLGLHAREKTPIRSPWWLTLLRMLIAAAVIAALAGPVIKPVTGATQTAAKPLVVAVDNGWGAASRWRTRQAFAGQIASLAEENRQVLYLIPAAGPRAPLSPLTPAEFRKRFASLAPQPFPGDRNLAAGQIERELGSLHGKAQAI